MTKPDGEPAFPGVKASHSGADNEGMTLRQWYAGQALAGLMSLNAECYRVSMPACAKDCYAYADAMIAEGGKE